MRRRRALTVVGVLAGVSALSVALAPAASAHPLGNFTRNTYVGFTISHASGSDTVTVDHVLDLAEVPTFQERHAMDTDGNGSVSPAESAAWGQARCAAAGTQITASTDRGPITWVVGRSVVTFPPGQGELPTTRLECGLSATVTGATSLQASVSIEQGRVGWREVTATGNGVALTSDVPAVTSSARLSAYPVGVPSLDVTSARVSWVPAAAGAVASAAPTVGGGGTGTDSAAVTAVTSIAPRGLDGATRAFTDLVGRHDITLGFGLLSLAIALLLGGLHALAPGHGKTLMAASLVGTAGRRRDAFVLGASVTTAHTAGVVALALALSLSSTIAPETAYPWLGLASATLAVGVGVSLLRQARRGGGLGHSHGPGGHTHGPAGHAHGPDGHSHADGGHAHPHPHPHDHPHPHPHAHDAHPAEHVHPHTHASAAAHDHPVAGAHTAVVVAPAPPAEKTGARVSLVGAAPSTERTSRPATRRVIALGLAGGLVPSPSAVVVLLAGFALGRSWFALLLVVAYGLGMAMTLCLTGIVLVRAGGLSRRVADGSAVPRPVAAVLTRLPLIAASVVIATGLWLGVRSLLAM